jgi:prepilin-type processing-associated H-X9-DG protein
MLHRRQIAESRENPMGETQIDFDFETAGLSAASKRRSRPAWRRRRSVRTLMKLVFAFACSFALIAWFVQAVWAAREAARRSQCTCNYCQILLALHNYHSEYNVFPPAYVADARGRPMHSWRVLLLPFMEQSALYNRYNFSEPWNGPNNITLLNSMPNGFACPSRYSSPTNLTSYVAITGPGTMFPGARSTKLDDVTDGTSNTLMIVEVADVNVPWTAPIDLDVRTMSFQINDPKRAGISSKHPGGANVGLADGRARWARNSITPGKLRAVITIAGGEGLSMDQALDEN